MSQIIQAIRGMNDILPNHIQYWHYLEKILRKLAVRYGYHEIRFPILERTELFKRSIGEVTDIVEKEMYTFEDRNGDSLTLRPEGTAVCVRAGIEHGLLYNQTQRLWYMGPMFRHERPQKGRYRQFQQFGMEAFGMAEPTIDAELILTTARLWRELGLDTQLELQLNSIGSLSARMHYRDELVNYFQRYQDQLDEDSKRRLQTNPLRILDSKNPVLKNIIEGAPQLLESLDEESAQHFAVLKELLDTAGVKYVINPRLVRGLDYYNKTVFEWVIVSHEGQQNTVCAGGRYDSLVQQLGGQPTPAVGYAMGLERVINLLANQEGQMPHAYFIMAGTLANQKGLSLAEKLRDALPKLRLAVDCVGGSFKSQFKRADKSGARLALILGEEEVNTSTISVKYLREDKPQDVVDFDKLEQHLNYYLKLN